MLERVRRWGVDLEGVRRMKKGEYNQYMLYKCMEFLIDKYIVIKIVLNKLDSHV